jgi:allantoin racemase
MIAETVRIGILNPNTTRSMTESVVEHAASSARPGTRLIPLTSRQGSAAIESHVDEVEGSLGVLREVERCERAADRPDGYVLACFGDTGLHGARQAASGPVVGMTEAALLTAALIAYRFSIVTMPSRTRSMSDRVVRELGLEHRCVVRAVDEPVAGIVGGALHLLELFVDQGRAAIAEDAAEAVILGCAGLSELVGPLQDALRIPVIEGVAAAVALTEGLLAQGLSTSRAGSFASSVTEDDRAGSGGVR